MSMHLLVSHALLDVKNVQLIMSVLNVKIQLKNLLAKEIHVFLVQLHSVILVHQLMSVLSMLSVQIQDNSLILKVLLVILVILLEDSVYSVMEKMFVKFVKTDSLQVLMEALVLNVISKIVSNAPKITNAILVKD